MNELFIFLLKAAIINGVIIGFYYFTLRESNRFRFMRATLLSAIILPLILPLLPFGEVNASGRQMLPAIELSMSEVSDLKVGESYNTLPDLPLLHELIYYIMATALLVGMTISIVIIVRKRFSADKYNSSFGEILLEKTVMIPFSFFSWVFISSKQLDHPKINMILRHEFCHVREMHSIDRVLSGILRSVLWFSPFAHLTGKFLTQVHEYQADAEVLTDEFSKDEYSDLLLSFYISSQTTRGITNNFSLLVKNRIIMINNLNAGKIRTKRIVAGLCIASCLVLMTAMVRSGTTESFSNLSNLQLSVDANNITAESFINNFTGNGTNNISQFIQKNAVNIDTTPPSFPGGDEAMMKYLISNVKYPEDARKSGVKGTVYVQFTVQADGKVTNPHVLRAVYPSIDKAAFTVIKDMPDWIPAKAGEKAIPFIFTVPLKFELENDSKKEQLDQKKEQEQKNSQSKKEIKPNQKSSVKSYKKPGTEIYTVVENPPKFPGGDQARAEYLSSKIVYPEGARKNGIEGTVYVSFIVQADGSVTDVKLLRGINKELDFVALEAVRTMPNWEPGRFEGKPVAVEFNMPIKFNLSDKNKKTN